MSLTKAEKQKRLKQWVDNFKRGGDLKEAAMLQSLLDNLQRKR